MIVKKETLTVRECYILGIEDTLKIENKGIKTKLYINDKEIRYIKKIELGQETGETIRLNIERFFLQKDFDNIKEYYE